MARQNANRVTMLGVAGRDSVASMEQFVARHGLEDMPQAVDADGAVWAQWGVFGQPAWAFVDGQTGEVELLLQPLGGAGLTERIDRLTANH